MYEYVKSDEYVLLSERERAKCHHNHDNHEIRGEHNQIKRATQDRFFLQVSSSTIVILLKSKRMHTNYLSSQQPQEPMLV